MDILNVLNSDLIFPLLALFVVVVYIVTRIRARRKFKR
jgi:flagellar biogenesis protein FliO